MKAEILYYPSIEFHNEEWVKRSLLYWDRVCRIVPEGYTPKDSDLILELKDNNLIKDIKVREPHRIDACNQFLRFIENHNAAGLVFNEDESEITYRLHEDKIDEKLQQVFDQYGLKKDDDFWFRLPKDAIGFYMMFLANTMAKAKKIVTGTDNEYCWSINPYFSERGNFDEFVYNPDSEGLYCDLILSDVLPKDINGLSSKDIIEFANNRFEEKALLRNKFEEILERIRIVTDRDQLESEINDLIEELEKAKLEYKESQKFMNSGMFGSSIAVGLPVSLAGISTPGMDPFNPFKLGGSLILGAISAIRDYKKLKKKRDKSYQSYLVGIENRTINRLSHRCHINFEEFIND